MQLSTRSNRLRLGNLPRCTAWEPPTFRFHYPERSKPAQACIIHRHNLGLKKGGGAGRVDQPSRGSLRASFQAQEQACLTISFCPSQLLFGILPLRRVPGKQAWLSQTFLCNMLWEEKPARNFRKSLPPPSFGNSCFSLGHEMAKLHQVVGNLAVLLDSQLRNHSLDAELGDACAKHSDNNNNNNNNTRDDNNNNNNQQQQQPYPQQ